MRTKIEAELGAWEHVAKAVLARRSALGMTQEELAAAAEVSPTTIRYLETAVRPAYRALTLARVAGALDWPASRFVDLLAGAEGASEDDELDSAAAERIRFLEAQVNDLTAKVNAIYDRLLAPAPPPPPATRSRQRKPPPR